MGVGWSRNSVLSDTGYEQENSNREQCCTDEAAEGGLLDAQVNAVADKRPKEDCRHDRQGRPHTGCGDETEDRIRGHPDRSHEQEDRHQIAAEGGLVDSLELVIEDQWWSTGAKEAGENS